MLSRDQFAVLGLSSSVEGKLTLTAKSEAFEVGLFQFSPRFEKVHDSIEISIMNNVEVEPSYHLLYPDPENFIDLRILRGSGDFIVRTNDSTLIDFKYEPGSRIIRVIPVKLGYAKIIVEDIRLVSSYISSCDIVVSTIDKLALKTENNLLQVGNSTKMEVIAYDFHRKKFSNDQLKYMKIHLNIDTDSEFSKTHALRISPIDNFPNQFKVEAKLTGEFKLIASSVTANGRGRGEQRIFSNQVDLHVFPKLIGRPPTVLIAPGCIGNIELVGGPSERSKNKYDVELIYYLPVDDRHLIDLTYQDGSLFHIEGLSTGSVDVQFILRYRHSKLEISRVEIAVKVELINAIDVLGMADRKIHAGTQIRLIALCNIVNFINFIYCSKI